MELLWTSWNRMKIRYSKRERAVSEFFCRSSTFIQTARQSMDASFIGNIERDSVSTRVAIVVRQITGAIARRIVAWAQIGDELKKGEQFGMIRFGSRTELYLPLNAEVLVKTGDHVLGGSTIIARLPD